MSGRIGMVDLALRHARVQARVERRVLDVLRSGRTVGGPVVVALEEQVALRMGRRFGVGVSCGTEALVLALQVAGVRPGGEVIVPALSFYATASAVLLAGATPVCVDVLPDRPLLDPEAAARAVTPRTQAVVPVHLFGDRAPFPDVPVPVVEDAAQAFGVPSQGLLVTLSFYPTKVLGGAGEGGMVLTDDPALAEQVRLLRNHGMTAPHVHTFPGGVLGRNARLDTLQAAIVLAHLEDIDERLARRRGIADRYDQAFGPLPVPRGEGPVSSYLLRTPERDRLRQALEQADIETAVYYPKPLSEQPGVPPASVPHAAAFCREALAIPCHPELTDAQVERVVATVQQSGVLG